MATNLQGYTVDAGNQLTAENAEFYQRTMLEALYDSVHFMKYGKKQNIPKNSGATTSWRRLEMPTIDSTAIVEGTTPDGIDLTINKITATVKQYGAWVKISDFLDLVGLDPVMMEIASLFGDHAGLTMDEVVRDIIAVGTNVVYAGGKANRASIVAGDNITYADILTIRATLVKNNAKKIKLPNGKMGYLAFTHPDVVTQVMQLQEWLDRNNTDFSNQEGAMVGQLGGIFFEETNTAPIVVNGSGSGTLDTYLTIVVGKDAYGIPDVSGSSKPDIIIKQPNGNDSDTSNPMNLYGTVAWKSTMTAVILEQKAIVRYESVLETV